MRLTGKDIVCVGFADWDADLWTNQHHLMSRLARRNRVLFVESLGLRRPQLDGRDMRRIVRRLRRGLRGPRAVDGLHVLSPLVIPFHSRPAVRRLNARLLANQVARAARSHGMDAPLLWSYNPQAEVLIEPLRASTVVYHCVDDIAAQKGVDGESFRAAEERFASRADLVVATSRPLAQRMRALSERVLEAPNVADTELFARALEPGPIDAAIEALPHPRVVFTGAVVATKVDVELLVELARRRRDWTFALVGPVGAGDPHSDVSALEHEPNIHLLGPRPYEKLPEVLRGGDAALIPYASNNLTRSIFPMKVYEYLAAGLPVVATPLESLRDVGVVATTADPRAMAACLEHLMVDDGAPARRVRSVLARDHSWDARLREIESALRDDG